MANLRERSRENFTGNETVEHINAGSLQRIADATELMAKNHLELVADRDRYKTWYEDYLSAYNAQIRSIRAYRAHITRLRRQLESERAAVRAEKQAALNAKFDMNIPL